MDIVSELVRVTNRRRDGWWGIIATALGDEAACLRTRAALSPEALGRGLHGNSPSVVEHRVHALAAFDPSQLVPLSRAWMDPTEIGHRLMDSAADLWVAAWKASLRFLKGQGETFDFSAKALPRVLAREFEVLFVTGTPVSLSSWSEARQWLLNVRDYDEIRRFDGLPVHFEAPLGESALASLLDNTEGHAPRLDVLRFFFRRTELINDEGRRYLERLAETYWASLHEFGTTPSGVTILVDLLLELVTLERREQVLRRLVASLELSPSPERLLPIVFLAVGRGWRHP